MFYKILVIKLINEPKVSQFFLKDEFIMIEEEIREAINIPECKYCSSIARPNILMFFLGESEMEKARISKKDIIIVG